MHFSCYNKFYDYFIVYDFETILSKKEICKTNSLKYTNQHVPVSFSIFSNVEGYNDKPIHVVNNDPKELIRIFVKKLIESNLIYGCGKPFQIIIQDDGTWIVQKCDYI